MSEQRDRFTSPTPEQLTAEQRHLFQSITNGPRASGLQAFPLTDDAGALNGPFALMLLQPGIGSALQEVGSAIRYAGLLSKREREIGILTVASATGCEFESWAHERIGLSIGMDKQELADIAVGTFDTPNSREQVCHDLPRLLVAGGQIDEGTFADAVECLGEGDLYELTVLTGYYTTMAWTMRVFGVGVPNGVGPR